jgi:hypothetical protein
VNAIVKRIACVTCYAGVLIFLLASVMGDVHEVMHVNLAEVAREFAFNEGAAVGLTICTYVIAFIVLLVLMARFMLRRRSQ